MAAPKRTTIRRTPSQWRRRRQRRILSTALAVLLAGVALIGADRSGLFGTQQAPDMDRYHDRAFPCVNVVDGDTLDIAIADGDRPHTRIRLWGVDTPETVKLNAPVEHFGPEASTFTRKQTEGKTVRIELLAHDTRDKYGRLLAYVYLPDGRMLNRAIIAEGYGYADPRFDHRDALSFARAMRDARQRQQGLWKDIRQRDLPYYLRRP
jgi:micrococcal nuclease